MSVPTSYDMGTVPRRLGQMSVPMSYDIGWGPQLMDHMSVPMSYDIGVHTRKMLTHVGTHVGADMDRCRYVVQPS
eukprot:5835055-Karenia_brevis.AAC.1